MTEAERDAYREQKRAEAERRLDELVTEPGWTQWLRLRRGLRGYSWSNQVLIASQAEDQATKAAEGHPDALAAPCSPTPTIVKPKSAWRRDGYHPAKGSRGLSVWTFCDRRRRDRTWSCCGAKRSGEVCPECGKRSFYFRLKPTFDASQVRSFETGEAPEIDPPRSAPIIGNDPGAALLRPLADWALAERIAGTIDLEAAADHGEKGSFNHATRHLRVCAEVDGARQSENGRLRVLIHELAHALGVSAHVSETMTPAMAEVGADCVAYVVASSAGLDTSADSIPYMAGWGGENPSGVVRQLAAAIDTAAKRIEEAMDAVTLTAIAD